MEKNRPGDEAMVKKLSLLDIKHPIWTAHLITDVLSTNPAVAAACAMNTEFKTVTEVGGFAELVVVQHHLAEIKKYTRRCMVVLDMSAFPLLLSMIRTGNPDKEVNAKGEAISAEDVSTIPASNHTNGLRTESPNTLTADIKNTWNTYNQDESIPLIVVNQWVPFTGLKCISYKQMRETLAKK